MLKKINIKKKKWDRLEKVELQTMNIHSSIFYMHFLLH